MSESEPQQLTLTFEQTAAVGKLAEALAAAQTEMDNAIKDSVNPHFKSSFADLASVRDAVRPLAKHKVAVTQWPQTRDDGTVGVRTQLTHATGEWMACTVWCRPQQAGPQALGSVITYLRRYSLASAACIAQEDDDGNSGDRRHANGNENGRAVEEPITAEQDKEIGGLFKVLKIQRGQATAICREVTGKDPAHLMKQDADRLIAELKSRTPVSA